MINTIRLFKTEITINLIIDPLCLFRDRVIDEAEITKRNSLMPYIKYVNIAYFVKPDWNMNKWLNRLMVVKNMK